MMLLCLLISFSILELEDLALLVVVNFLTDILSKCFSLSHAIVYALKYSCLCLQMFKRLSVGHVDHDNGIHLFCHIIQFHIFG